MNGDKRLRSTWGMPQECPGAAKGWPWEPGLEWLSGADQKVLTDLANQSDFLLGAAGSRGSLVSKSM